MSSVLELIPQMFEQGERNASVEEACQRTRVAAYKDRFINSAIAEEQISGLVREIFLPGSKRKARQIMFSAVDEEVEIGSLCMMVGETLNLQDPGTTCVVEAVPHCATTGVRAIDEPVSRQSKFGILRDAAQQLSDRLWFMPRELLREDSAPQWSVSWLRGRLAELRLDFDYTVLQGPALGSRDEATLLATLCDGVVLVLVANRTRRLVAKQVREKLRSANARVLGAVMTERTFPIPEAIYRKL
jgi:hypothetical protein